MSYIQVRDDLDLYEYWKLLSVAASTDERDDYTLASMVYVGVNDPRKLKKIRPDSKTVSRSSPGQALFNMAAAMSGGDMKPSGSAQEWAKATGRRIIYAIAPNTYVDEAGNPTERTRDDFVLRLPQEIQ